jgi:hypothetical protein
LQIRLCHAIIVGMMTITVDIPPSRRLSLELPETVPVGKATLTVYPAEGETRDTLRSQFEPFPTIEELKADAEAKYAAWKDSGEDPLIKWRDSLGGKKIFDCNYNYQRSIRDEWD